MIDQPETTIAIELPTSLARWLADNIQCQYAMEQENGGEGEGGRCARYSARFTAA